MTEERIRELAEDYIARGLTRYLRDLIRTVAAEARDEGIDEMAGAICKFTPAIRIEWVRVEAERLKEKRK